tara:strand:+ start:1427 stop:1639 length:213 start_codon:yes stop_codon:yes gene_type:complete
LLLLVLPLHQHQTDLTLQETSGLLVVVVDHLMLQDQIQEELVVVDLTKLLHTLVVVLVELVTIQIAPLMG